MTARCMALALLLIVPLAALAQTALPEYAWIGAGVRTRPAYDGSVAQRTDLIPTVRYYGKPWFARTTQGILEGGARTELARGLNVGAQLAYEG
ncbi:MAG: MipA/OmpV family protein, partial [Betaproteobacteria bacterium]